MTDDETQRAGTFEAEFRRQMRSGQVRRFVGALPAFAVQRDTPDRFIRLLQELDDMPSEGQDISPTTPVRMRQN